MSNGQLYNAGACCCTPACYLLVSNSSTPGYTGPLVPTDWTYNPSDWTVNTSTITTSATNSNIIWNGTYTPSNGIGVALTFTPSLTTAAMRLIFDYVDDDNYHFIEMRRSAVLPAPSTFHFFSDLDFSRILVYRRTTGINALVWDYPYFSGSGVGGVLGGMSLSFVGSRLHIGNLNSGVSTIGIDLTPHGGNRVGIGMGGTAQSFTFSNLRFLNYNNGACFDGRSNKCPTCLVGENAYHLKLTLKMNSKCAGGSLPATELLIPFVGTAYEGTCTWRLEEDLPCGFDAITIVQHKYTSGLLGTSDQDFIVSFEPWPTWPVANIEFKFTSGCSGAGVLTLAGGNTLLYLPFGGPLLASTDFDVSVMALEKV